MRTATQEGNAELNRAQATQAGLILLLLLLIAPPLWAGPPGCQRSLQPLQAICGSVLECEMIKAGPIKPGQGRIGHTCQGTSKPTGEAGPAMLLHPAASKSFNFAIAILRAQAGDSGQVTGKRNAVFRGDWSRREWIAELMDCIAKGSCRIDVGKDTVNSRNRTESKNRLRRPIIGNIAAATELTRQIYGAHCDSPRSCLRWLGSFGNRWQVEQRLKEQAIAAQQQASDVNEVSQSVIEDKLEAQSDAVHEHSATMREHAKELSKAQQISGLTVGGAFLEALVTDNPDGGFPHDESPPANRSSQGPPVDLNLTDATLQLARATGKLSSATSEIAYNLANGLQSIADAIVLASMGQRQPAEGAVARQIDPDADFALTYPKADVFGYAILLIPDPRIPRHRRGYDLSLAAISRGMLEAGFVLDRYAMPWQKYLDDLAAGSSKVVLDSQGLDDGKFGVLIYRRDRFREEPKNALGSELRILYVVAESGTYGVQQKALVRALLRIERVVQQVENIYANGLERSDSRPATVHQRLHYVDGAFSIKADGELTWRKQPGNTADTLIIGPSFSGSMASILEALGVAQKSAGNGGLTSAADLRLLRTAILQLQQDEHGLHGEKRALMMRARTEIHRRFELHSTKGFLTAANVQDLQVVLDEQSKPDSTLRWSELSAQVKTQAYWVSASRAAELPLHIVSATMTASSNFNLTRDGLRVSSVAIPDALKLKYLHAALPQRCGASPCGDRDVVIFSEASSFGAGLCNGSHDQLCARAFEIHFPANISDIRVGERGLQRSAEKQALNKLGLPDQGSTLDLAEGQENGSEFPDSQRSALTTASAERELSQALRHVKALRPRMIVVAATDIRDRLFLFDRLRRMAPRALLVDLEADVLMAHPSIIHATRGTLLLSSGRLESQLPQCCSSPCSSSVSMNSFVNDDQWAQFGIISHLAGAGNSTSVHLPTGCALPAVDAVRMDLPRVHAYSPTRSGLRLVGRAYVSNDSNDSLRTSVAAGNIEWGRLLSSLMVPLLLMVLFLLLEARRSAADSLQARVGNPQQRWEFPPILLLAAVFVVAFSLRAAFVVDLSDEQPSGFSFGLDSGLSWIGALVILLSIVICLGFYLYRLTELYWLRRDLATDVPSRPLLLCNVKGQVRRLQELDIVSWPLLVLIAAWLWLASGSLNNTLCTSCWPRVSLLGFWAELPLLLGFMLLTAFAVAMFWHASGVFRQLLDSAERLEQMVLASGRTELACWSQLAGALVLLQRTFGDLQVVNQTTLGNPQRLVWAKPKFAHTPFLAKPGEFAWPLAALQANPVLTSADVRQILGTLNSGLVDTLSLRLAIGMYFANMVASIRLAMVMGMLAFSGVVAMGYAYPVTDRDQYLIFALLAMALGAVFLAYVVMALERIPVVSRLLCNTKAGLNLNWTFLISVLTPFLVVLAVVFVMEVPGVLEWSGGIFGRVLGWIGL